MSEVTLVGGPMDGDTVEVKAGQVDVLKDGCTYRHQEATGFYCYSEGEKESKPLRRPNRTKLTESER